jgi:putative hemolysin
MEGLAVPIGALVALLALSGFFSSSETALMAVSRYRLRYLERRGDPRAKLVRRLIASPDRLLSSILLGNNFVNTAASAVATSIALQAAGANGVIVATIVMTGLILIFSEVAPKTLAARRPEALALRVARPIQLVVALLYPLAGAASAIANFLLRPFSDGTGSPKMSIEDITGMLEIGVEERVIAREKRRMVQSIFRLTETTIEDVMIPRTQVKAIAFDSDPLEVVRVIQSSGVTRLPVYRESLDDVVGILHSKDVIKYWHRPQDLRVEQLLRKPFYVPETATLETLLRLFRQHRQHLALVIDEHGGVEGIVSLEDLIEEIVGDIEDEHDTPQRPQLVELDEDSLLVDGTCPLSLLERRYSLALDSEDSATIAGFIMEVSGEIPQSGARVTWEELTFEIQRASGNRIDLVRIEGVVRRRLRQPS